MPKKSVKHPILVNRATAKSLYRVISAANPALILKSEARNVLDQLEAILVRSDKVYEPY
jgi:hypothetical protein